MKVALKVICLALLFSNINAVQAISTISSVSIEVFPISGDITTNITIQVRGEPHRRDYITKSRDYPILNIYFDDVLIANQIKPVTYPKYGDYSYYEASWDYSFMVPNKYPYSELGEHVITAKVEAADGTTETNTANFTINNYIPPPEWWEDLPDDFIDSIRGPAGEQGPQGIQGEPGESYPVMTFYFIIGASAIALLVSLSALIKPR